MNWFSLLINDKPLSLYYDAPPTLRQVELHEVTLDRDGPTLSLRLDFAEYADNPPAKWHPEWNTVQATFSFIDVSDLKVDGWGRDNLVDVKLDKTDGAIRVDVSGDTTRISFKCKFVNVPEVTAYCEE